MPLERRKRLVAGGRVLSDVDILFRSGQTLHLHTLLVTYLDHLAVQHCAEVVRNFFLGDVGRNVLHHDGEICRYMIG